MKRLVITACLLVISTNLASAQTGAICLFSDPQGTVCSISDNTPGLIAVYAVHVGAVDVTGTWFSAPVPWCMDGAVFLSDAPAWPVTIGDTQNGIWVGYGACVSSPIHVLTINVFGQGLTSADCPFTVLPHPQYGEVRVTDCNDLNLAAASGITYVNSDLPCVCNTTLPDPILVVDPLFLDFGLPLTQKYFVIGNLGGGTVIWNVTESVPWLDAAPTSGAGNAQITVTVDRSGLAHGSYSGSILVSTNAGNRIVTVDMEVPATVPVLLVAPTELNFVATDDEEYLAIRNAGTGELTWSISSDQTWLAVDRTTGNGETNVIVSVDRTGLSDGTYHGNLLVTSNGGDETVPVEMIVAMQPVLSVAPTVLTFSELVTSRGFSIANTGFGTLTWSLSADQTWIEIVPPLSGSGDTWVTVNVDPANVPEDGTVTGHITVSSNAGTQVIDVLFSPPGESQGGGIGVFAETNGIDCNIVDAAPGLLEVYVVHTNTEGATASQFAAPMPSCMTGASWLSDAAVFPVTVGDSQTGVAVGYGSCRAWPIHVLTIQYLASGQSETCCMYPVIPNPNAESGKIEVVDCENALVFGHGLTSSVNADATCMCGTVKVEETTWGKVKAIYAPEHLKAIRR